jgi:hypothetical protein
MISVQGECRVLDRPPLIVAWRWGLGQRSIAPLLNRQRFSDTGPYDWNGM